MKSKRTDENPQVERIKALFGEGRKFEDSHNIAAARRIERQVAALVAEVEAAHPSTEAHADALAFHEYTLLSLSRTSKRADMQKKYRDQAYRQGARSVDIRLSTGADLGTGFAAYNLAIDLIESEKRPEDGLAYMLKARRVLRKLPKNRRPRNFGFFWIEYGIAHAQYMLGDKEKAAKQLRRTLRHATELEKLDFGDLRGLAKAAELLAQIKLDILDEKRKASQAA